MVPLQHPALTAWTGCGTPTADDPQRGDTDRQNVRLAAGCIAARRTSAQSRGRKRPAHRSSLQISMLVGPPVFHNHPAADDGVIMSIDSSRVFPFFLASTAHLPGWCSIGAPLCALSHPAHCGGCRAYGRAGRGPDHCSMPGLGGPPEPSEASPTPESVAPSSWKCLRSSPDMTSSSGGT